MATAGRSAEAGTKAYSIDPTDANFSGVDWTVGTAPAATPTTTLATWDSLYFGGTPTYTTLTNDGAAGFDVAGLTFNADAAAFTINGNALNLSGGITPAGTSARLISTAPTLTASQTVATADGGALTLGGLISDAGVGYGLTFTGTV